VPIRGQSPACERPKRRHRQTACCPAEFQSPPAPNLYRWVKGRLRGDVGIATSLPRIADDLLQCASRQRHAQQRNFDARSQRSLGSQLHSMPDRTTAIRSHFARRASLGSRASMRAIDLHAWACQANAGHAPGAKLLPRLPRATRSMEAPLAGCERSCGGLVATLTRTTGAMDVIG
jgi:hypothetical protein